MKKLDILVLKYFVGSFILATAVCNFILLIQHLLKYFDDFVGKNLGFTVFAELLFYFSLNVLQGALPLGVLLSSLIAFGNLGENFELTAIKSSGISILRTLRPAFLFIVLVSIGVYFFNNYTIPLVNLKAYSLLYDIKHTKPALDIKAGAFYNGIPDYSIKAKDKLSDGKTLIDVMIYDHSNGRGNKTVIMADTGIMYTILDDKYLKLELYNGHHYSEKSVYDNSVDRFHRTKYQKMDIVFSLSSFNLQRRKEELFRNNRQMRNISELTHDIDSFKYIVLRQKIGFIQSVQNYFDYHLKNKKTIIEKGLLKKKDDLRNAKNEAKASFFPIYSLIQRYQKGGKNRQQIFPYKDTLNVNILEKIKTVESINEVDTFQLPSLRMIKLDEDIQMGKEKNRNILKTNKIDTLTWDHLYFYLKRRNITNKVVIAGAFGTAKSIKSNLGSVKINMYELQKHADLYTVEKYKKYAQSLACVLMFLIGAPLGAIIKKGGLGVPTIIAIFFFIVYYIFSSIGEKQAKEGVMNPHVAVWMSDMILLPFGLFFLRQAKIDARIFELDAAMMNIEKLKHIFVTKKKKA